MSYTPTTWTSGDIVTSAKLNKIENGIVEASSSGGCEVIQGTYVNNYNSESGSGGRIVKSLKSTSSTSSVLDYSEYIEWPISYEGLYNKIISGTIVLLAANTSDENDSWSTCSLVLAADASISESSYRFIIVSGRNFAIISNTSPGFDVSSSDNIVYILNLGSAPTEQEQPTQ